MTNPDYIRDLCKHEIGHYYIGLIFGFEMGKIVISKFYSTEHTSNSTAEIFLNFPINNMDQLKTYLEKRIIVLWSGILVQSLSENSYKINQKDVKKLAKTSGKNDCSKIIEHIKILHNIQLASDTNYNINKLKINEFKMIIKTKKRAIKLVEENAEKIMAIVSELYDTQVKDQLIYIKPEDNSITISKEAIEKLKSFPTDYIPKTFY